MLKRILIVVDESDASYAAKLYAIKLAKQKKCKLTGIGIIDIPWITAAQPEPLGGGAYKIYRDQEVISKTHHKVKELLKDFEEMSNKEKVDCLIFEREGWPASEIENLSEEHDIIVIGKATDFHFELEEDSNLTVRHLARDNPRPIIVVPSKENDISEDHNILIAYDGSLQAARSLHMFLLLGLARDKKLHLTSVAKTKAEANRIVGPAQRMCEQHGYKASSEGIESSESIELILKEKIKTMKPSLLVMGAYSRNGLKELIFGSTTEHMIKDPSVPVFIHH